MGRTRGWSGRRNNKEKNNNKPGVVVQPPASPAHRDLHTSFGQTPHSDKVAVLVTDKFLRIAQDLCDQLLCQYWREMLKEALEDSATKSMPGGKGSMPPQLLQNKLHFFWRHDFNALLEHVIRIG